MKNVRVSFPLTIFTDSFSLRQPSIKDKSALKQQRTVHLSELKFYESKNGRVSGFLHLTGGRRKKGYQRDRTAMQIHLRIYSGVFIDFLKNI